MNVLLFHVSFHRQISIEIFFSLIPHSLWIIRVGISSRQIPKIRKPIPKETNVVGVPGVIGLRQPRCSTCNDVPGGFVCRVCGDIDVTSVLKRDKKC